MDLHGETPNEEDTWLQIKIISLVKPNERLSSTGPLLRVDCASRYQCISRWWRGETRGDNTEALGRVIHHALHLVRNGATWLLPDLKHACVGLHNLCVTYARDSLTQAKLQVLLAKIRDVTALIPDTGECCAPRPTPWISYEKKVK